MHERSLTASLLKQVAQIQAKHAQSVVSEVVVEVGPLSGVEPELLQSAFSEMRSSGMQLRIQQVLMKVHCLSCGNESYLKSLVFYCPICQSAELQIIGGDALRLLYVTMAEPEQGTL